MAKETKAFTQSNRAAPPVQHQRAIVEQTAAFLANGGKIQQIPNGVSGQPKLGGPKLATAQEDGTTPAAQDAQ